MAAMAGKYKALRSRGPPVFESRVLRSIELPYSCRRGTSPPLCCQGCCQIHFLKLSRLGLFGFRDERCCTKQFLYVRAVELISVRFCIDHFVLRYI